MRVSPVAACPATVKFGVILLVCSMVSLGAGFLSGKYAAVAGAGFAKNLRKDQFEKVQGFSFTNIDRFSTGSIVTRLTTDVTNLQNAYMMIIRLGVRAPIMVVVSWLFSFRISPSISMVFLACIPILAIGLCGLAVLVHPVFERVFHTYDALNNVVDENLQASAWSSPITANPSRSPVRPHLPAHLQGLHQG